MAGPNEANFLPPQAVPRVRTLRPAGRPIHQEPGAAHRDGEPAMSLAV